MNKCQLCGEKEEGWSHREWTVEELHRLRSLQNFNEFIEVGYRQLMEDEIYRMITNITEGGGRLVEQAEAQLKQIATVNHEVEKNIVGELGELTREVEEAQVLQTYVVGHKEIYKDAELWKEPIMAEVKSLMDSGTIVPVKKEDTDQDGNTEVIPGKLICTRKAPNGRRKARIVGCGNYATSHTQEDLNNSTGGLDATSFRILMMMAAQRTYAVGSVDVKRAFLQAPRRAARTRTTLVRPPALLFQLGLLEPNTWWRVDGALYGLPESPADWTTHRNIEMRTTSWDFEGKKMRMEQSAEANIWKVIQEGRAVAYMGTYVDDLVVVGETKYVNTTLSHITRVRVDVAFHVGFASRMIHKRPKMVLKLVEEILGYLRQTEDMGLRYQKVDTGCDYGSEGELKFAKAINHVEAYADASFAPAAEGMKSVHGTVISVAGCPIMWTTAKQPFITQSTAEAELLSYMEAHQQAEGVGLMLEALDVEGIRKCLYGDNRSAIQLCKCDVGSWRTRHLRLRAAGLRESMMSEETQWFAHHVNGSVLIADLLTKAVMGQQFTKLIKLLGMVKLEEKEIQVKRATTRTPTTRTSTTSFGTPTTCTTRATSSTSGTPLQRETTGTNDVVAKGDFLDIGVTTVGEYMRDNGRVLEYNTKLHLDEGDHHKDVF